VNELDFTLLAAVQNWGTAMRPVMSAFSSAGYGAIYIAVISFVYWCLSPRNALRLGVLLLLSSCVNTLVKVVVHDPRPYWVRPELFTGAVDAAAGNPSGHAQASTAFWGLLASFSRRPLWWALCIVMIAGTSVSRIYFGVHFPSQIVVGMAIGLALLFLFHHVEAPVTRRFLARSRAQQRMLLVAGWLGLMGLMFTVQALVAAGWSAPAEWSANAAAVHPAIAIDVLQVSTGVRDVSLLLGLLLGASAFANSPLRYPGLRTALLRFVPGYALFAVFWLGTGALARHLPMDAQLVTDAVRGLIGGLWISLLWPLVLRRFYRF
jgi:membrane-associated phospholipid phosphatase